MPKIASLTGVSFQALAEVFTEAFSDYVVPMRIDAAALEAMQRRRGYVAEASFGAFDDDGRLVGFVLTCLDAARAYNSGTGIVPAHRRGGLARELLDAVEASVRDRAEAYVLEVIETNHAARRLYERAGFVETRGLQSYRLEGAAPAGEPLPRVAAPDLERFASIFDVEPSWQNSIGSIRRAIEPWVALGDERGIVVVFPESGDLPLLTVHPDVRRQNHGRRLLASAAAQTGGKPLRIVNVDERSDAIERFLSAAGAEKWIRQVEMVRSLRKDAALPRSD